MTHNHKLIGAYHDGCAACALDKLHGKAPAREAPAREPLVGYYRKPMR